MAIRTKQEQLVVVAFGMALGSQLPWLTVPGTFFTQQLKLLSKLDYLLHLLRAFNCFLLWRIKSKLLNGDSRVSASLL